MSTASKLFNFSREDVVRASLLLRPTIGSPVWMALNSGRLPVFLPLNWSDLSRGVLLRLAYEFTVIGVEWESIEHVKIALLYFQKLGLAEIWEDSSSGRFMIRRKS